MAGSIIGKPAVAEVIHFASFDAQAISRLIALEGESTPHPWTVSMLEGSLAATADCRKIYVDTDVIGYWVVQRIEQQAEILNIVIFKSCQAQGHGHTVICKLQQDLAKLGVQKLFLEVRSSNHVARALYAKSGFTQLGIRKAYYRTKNPDEQAEDALILACDLGKH